jgi:hypothetical protein
MYIFGVRKIELENEDSARELRAAVERGEYLLDRINYGRSATKFAFNGECSVADPDPGSGIGCFLTPGSGIRNRFFPDPGSRIPDAKTIFLRAF